RVAPIVQAVEVGDQVVPAAGELLGRRDVEGHSVRYARLERCLAGALDRWRVVVEAEEARRGIGLGEENGRGAVATADVGDGGASRQLLMDAIQSRDPGRHEIAGVGGAEGPLRGGE